MRNLFFLAVVFVSAGFTLTAETKKAPIAFYQNNVPAFYDKSVFTERLIVELKENLKISAPGRKEKLIIETIEFDTLEIKKINDVNYVYASGKTGLIDRPLFVCYIGLTLEGNDLMIISKNNKNVFCACAAYPKLVVHEITPKRSPYSVGRFEYSDYAMEDKHTSISTSVFTENGLGLYFK